MSANILLVCIAFGNYPEVAKYLEAALRQDWGGNLHISVVDNTEDCESGPPVDWLGPRACEAMQSGELILLGRGRNRGYWGGMRHGITEAWRHWGRDFDWTVISNTDIEFNDGQSVNIGAREVCPATAAIAPRITSSLSGRDQNPLYGLRPTPRKFLLLSWVFRSALTTMVHRVAAYSKARVLSRLRRPAAPVNIFAPHGSFVFLSRGYFEKGGALEYPAFLFCEEIFLAEEVVSLGMRIEYEPNLRVTHLEHASTGFFPNPKLRRHLADAHLAAYRRLSR